MPSNVAHIMPHSSNCWRPSHAQLLTIKMVTRDMITTVICSHSRACPQCMHNPTRPSTTHHRQSLSGQNRGESCWKEVMNVKLTHQPAQVVHRATHTCSERILFQPWQAITPTPTEWGHRHTGSNKLQYSHRGSCWLPWHILYAWMLVC